MGRGEVVESLVYDEDLNILRIYELFLLNFHSNGKNK